MYICNENQEKPPYIPGLERRSLYKSIWLRHWKSFQKEYTNSLEKQFGKLPREKKAEVLKLLTCGKFQKGFQRHTCVKCGLVLVVPFTCKSRLCLSCARKRLFGWSLNLSIIMNELLDHIHITFTIPGQLSDLLFERNYNTSQMISLTAGVMQNFLRRSANVKGKEFKPEILANLHKSGNSLNYNPHIHLITSRELVNIKTGEILTPRFLNYKEIRFNWQKAFLNHLKIKGVLSEEEKRQLHGKYKNGFNDHFQPIIGNANDKLFRTAEYIATGYFHNSQIVSVDHEKKTVTFRYRKFVDRVPKKKHYGLKTMDIYEFMARLSRMPGLKL